MMLHTNAQWVQAACMSLAVKGYDPNVVMRELSAYVAGQRYNFAIIQLALAEEGIPPNPWDYKHDYEKHRARWIETGDLSALLAMIDAVRLERL